MTLMTKVGIRVGDLAKLNPSYTSGIWLRKTVDSWAAGENGHITHDEIILIVNVENSISRDPSVFVVSSSGRVGWTFASRLGDL